MSREYPDWLDPRKAAEGRRTFSGSMPLARMTRLQPLLADLAEKNGQAWFSARFRFDHFGRVTINVTVEASLPLVCQRSLEPYLEPISRQSLLGVMEDLAEEDLMPENYEPVLVKNHRLALLNLVEDELLLGLPQVPRNPQVAAIGPDLDKAVTGKDGGQQHPLRQPFAGLAEQLQAHARQKNRDR